jgi:hypothetical protein
MRTPEQELEISQQIAQKVFDVSGKSFSAEYVRGLVFHKAAISVRAFSSQLSKLAFSLRKSKGRGTRKNPYKYSDLFRAKYFEREEHICNTQKRAVESWRPIIDWTEKEVWAIIERWKVQPHPCYELGYPRCSCQICIFGSENIWASNSELSDEKIQYIEDREKLFGFTLFNGMGIREKVKKGKSFLKKEKVARWANEALVCFTSPIFVENWTLPQGAFASERAGSI